MHQERRCNKSKKRGLLKVVLGLEPRTRERFEVMIKISRANRYTIQPC
jgi:hypothetical protein